VEQLFRVLNRAILELMVTVLMVEVYLLTLLILIRELVVEVQVQ
jgi:hypothetical protein